MSTSEPPLTNCQNIDWCSWAPQHRVAVVCIHTTNAVCLIHKKRGFGAGKVVLPGGKQHPDESLEACAKRECFEEVGLHLSDLKHYGTLQYQFLSGYKLQLEVFATTTFSGQLIETAEALPFWSNKRHLPFEDMWPDTRLWLPQILLNQSFKGRFLFAEERMLDMEWTTKDTN